MEEEDMSSLGYGMVWYHWSCDQQVAAAKKIVIQVDFLSELNEIARACWHVGKRQRPSKDPKGSSNAQRQKQHNPSILEHAFECNALQSTLRTICSYCKHNDRRQ